MAELDIIDAHHHLTDLSRSYPWLEGPPKPRYHGNDLPLRRSYLLDDYLADMGRYRLLGSVHIENGAADPLLEAKWVDGVSRERGLPSVQVGKVSLLDPNARQQLERLSQINTMRGIRDILNWHENPIYSHRDRGNIMTDPTWLTNFSLLAALELSFDLQVFPSQLRAASELAAKHPETSIILDHAGMPIGRDEDSLAEWRTGMRLLASHPNVVTKISALGTNDHQWTTESISPFVLETIDIFGPSRTMFGSNFPVDSLYSSFATLYEAFDHLTADFSSDDRRNLFVSTAARSYRIKL